MCSARPSHTDATPGIEVSEQTGPVQWSRVAAGGIRFAFLRATQGTRVVDNSYGRHAERARDAGILVVPYHVVNAEPADLQAAHFMNIAKLRQGSVSDLRYSAELREIARDIEKALWLQTRRTPIPAGLFRREDGRGWFTGTAGELRAFYRNGAIP